jgi:hypothetical protein
MAIADWFIVKSDAAMDVNLEIGSPIDGTGSLRISQDAIAATEPVASAHLRLMAGPPQSQFLKGKVRTLIQPKQFTDGATSVSFMGILGMMSQADVFAAGGQGYFAGRWGGATPSWWIARVDNGVTGTGSFTVLASGTTTNLPGVDDIRAIEFEWVYDPLEFNGTRLTFSAAPDDDFGNLVQIYQVVDTGASALDSSVGEGLFFSALHSVAGPVVETFYDKTTIFELVPV